MFPCPTTSLLLSLTALLLISVDHSSCRQYLSRRGTHSFSAFSNHRFVRRSLSRTPSVFHRRSLLESGDNFKGPDSLFDPDGGMINFRRSIDEKHDDDSRSHSLDRLRDEGQLLWDEFVEPTSGEDPDFYPGCDDVEDDNSAKTSDSHTTSTPPKDSPEKKEPPKSRSSSSTQPPVVGSLDEQPSLQENKKRPDNQNDSLKADDEARKAKEAEKNRTEQEAAQKAQVVSKQAGEDAKQQEAEKAKKEQEAADADRVRKEQEANSKKEDDHPKATNVKKIPGTNVVTGTVAAHPKEGTYVTPSSDTHTGDATFYKPDVGACGKSNTEGELVVAVSRILYDSFKQQPGNPNSNEVCGKKIHAQYNGRSVDVTVVDRCDDCAEHSLDFSPTAFEKLGTKEEGRLHGMTWTFV